MATGITYDVNVVRHDNHVPPASLTLRSFPNQSTRTFLLSNVSSATTMKISFDGSNTFTIKPGGVLAMNFNQIKSYWTQGDGAGACEVLLGSEQ